MTTSPDIPESSDLPTSTRGPMALILAALRSPVALSITRLSQLAASGPLNPQQIEHYNDAVRALQQIARTVEQYAPPVDRAPARVARGEHWDAGEQSDALDDRFQDARLPLEDRPGRDEQP
ncbi:MAG: hypothetical protein IPK52_02285 [Chloroflexi bacterium]|nr:hypothetical protein [Chloroflexota bacterium]